MKKDKSSRTIRILAIIIAILVLFILVVFLVRPGIAQFAYKNQVQGANAVYADMLVQLQNTGAYQIKVGEQTLVLVPYQGA